MATAKPPKIFSISSSEDSKFLRSRVTEATTSFEKCILPINNLEHNRQSFIGSGFILNIDNRYFFITASHVINRIQNEFSIPGCTIMKDYTLVHIDAENIDCAFFELEKIPPSKKALKLDDIIVYDKSPKKGYLWFAGFPASRVKEGVHLRARLYKLITIEATNHEYLESKIDPFTNILLSFHRDRVSNESDELTRFPKPNGISGSPLFWIHQNIYKDNVPSRLVGMIIAWDDIHQRGIYAVKIEYILAGLRKHFNIGSIPDYLTEGIEVRNYE